MPLHAPGPYLTKSFALSKGAKSSFVRWILCRLGLVERMTGYLVSAEVAMAELSKKALLTSCWYHENAPEFLDPRRVFMFDARFGRTNATEPKTGP